MLFINLRDTLREGERLELKNYSTKQKDSITIVTDVISGHCNF